MKKGYKPELAKSFYTLYSNSFGPIGPVGDSCLPAANSSPPEGVPGTVPSLLVPPPPPAVPMMDCRVNSRSANELKEKITDCSVFYTIRITG